MSPLHLLLLARDAGDAARVVGALADAGMRIDPLRVATLSELAAELEGGQPDAIVLDGSVRPLDALAVVESCGYDGPVVVVAADEDAAVEAMRAGAHDAVRADDLRRLPPALERELAAARLRVERRSANRRLEDTETLFQALIENSLDVTTILTGDGTIAYASPSWQRVLGYRPEDVEGRPADGFVHSDDVPLLSDLFAQASEIPDARPTVELRVLHADGSWRLMEAVGLNLLEEPAVRGVVVTSRDVTSRRALETRLRQAERLEAVGQLAGGVAHDFNNVLLVIRGYSSILSATLDDPQQLADVEEIARAADRAATLTRQLLAFGRRQTVQPRTLSVADVVLDIESLLRRTIREDIELALRLAEPSPPVVADPADIEQVVVNLALNARDAIEGAGTIVISVDEVELAAPDPGVSPPLAPGRYVSLAVADTGSGISETVLPHVFEPFFTTKDEGIRTGLGLSTVYGIVAQSGGGVATRTAPDRGTTFTVYLPVAADADDRAPERQGTALARGTETILVVEDEEPVRELVRRVLENAGYRVISAGRPSEAERLLGDLPSVDLLLTDVVMPEMTGYDLAARVRERRPEILTLYISGYSGAAGEAATTASGQLLKKPFGPDQLTEAVRRALDGPRQLEIA